MESQMIQEGAEGQGTDFGELGVFSVNSPQDGTKFYRRLFENHPSVMLLVDPVTGDIRDANLAACTFYGYSREEMIRRKITDINVQEVDQTIQDMHKALTGARNQFFFRHRLASGEIRDVEVHSGSIGTNGKTLLYSIIHDITRRLEMEKALAREVEIDTALAELSKALMSPASIETISSLVLEHARRLTRSEYGFVGHLDPLTGSLISTTLSQEIWDACQVSDKTVVFHKFGGLWGWALRSRQPVLTNSPSEDIHSGGVPEGHIPVENFLAMPAVASDTLHGLVALANCPDGYTEQDKALLQRLATIFAVAVGRKWADEALQEERDFNRAILDIDGALIVVLDSKGHLVRFNRAAERITGYPADEAMKGGSSFWRQVIPPDGEEGVSDTFWKVLSGFYPCYHENDILSRDGSRHRITWTTSGLTDAEGKVNYVIAIGIDVTEHRRAQAEKDKIEGEIEIHHHLMRSLEQERQKIARDIHDGPLQGMYGISYSLASLQELSDQDQVRNILGEVRDVVLEQISDLRSFASDLRSPTVKDFGLERAIGAHAREINAKHPSLALHLDLEPDGRILPEAVRMALFRIYRELMINIERHAEAGEVSIRMTFDENQVILAVRDNGRGFEVPSDWRELARGQHLGLVGTMERAESLGGTVSIQSRPGEGTSVEVRIPLDLGDAEFVEAEKLALRE